MTTRTLLVFAALILGGCHHAGFPEDRVSREARLAHLRKQGRELAAFQRNSVWPIPDATKAPRP